jgi:hypothetical protein
MDHDRGAPEAVTAHLSDPVEQASRRIRSHGRPGVQPRPGRTWPSPPRPRHRGSTHAAALELDPIDPSREGMADYCGALLADVGLAAFSHSALVRIADEVCLQMHLLNLSSGSRCARAGADTEQARSICAKQLIVVAGPAAERIRHALYWPTMLRAPCASLNCIRCSTRPTMFHADLTEQRLRLAPWRMDQLG